MPRVKVRVVKRPVRLFKDKRGQRYFIDKNGKKITIKSPLDDLSLVKVIINTVSKSRVPYKGKRPPKAVNNLLGLTPDEFAKNLVAQYLKTNPAQEKANGASTAALKAELAKAAEDSVKSGIKKIRKDVADSEAKIEAKLTAVNEQVKQETEKATVAAEKASKRAKSAKKKAVETASAIVNIPQKQAPAPPPPPPRKPPTDAELELFVKPLGLEKMKDLIIKSTEKKTPSDMDKIKKFFTSSKTTENKIAAKLVDKNREELRAIYELEKTSKNPVNVANELKKVIGIPPDEEKKNEGKQEVPEQKAPEESKPIVANGADSRPGGLWNDQIDKIMRGMEGNGAVKNYLGTISSDEIKTLKLPAGQPSSFIMNLDKSDQPGSHWVGVFIDPNSEVGYFDSFGRNPPKNFNRDILSLLSDIRPETFLKLKVNRVVSQDDDSTTCGYHAIKYLLRRYAGESFKQATGFVKPSKKPLIVAGKVKKEEALAEKMKEEAKPIIGGSKFGYI